MKRKLDFVLKSKGGSIIFEDEDIIVLDKPPRLLVLPDRYDETLPNLYHILKEELGEIFVVHRLDKETSGVVIFAKNAVAHSNLSLQFENRRVTKKYEAIVYGKPDGMKGTINIPLAESKNHPGVMKADAKHGKPSVTDYNVVESFDGYALVEAEPKSGRTHQVRVHLASAGLPIVCDRVYGGGRPFFLSQVKPKYYTEGDEKPLLSRTALHAALIALKHPVSGENVTFKCEMPKDMRSVLNYLRRFKPADSRSIKYGVPLQDG